MLPPGASLPRQSRPAQGEEAPAGAQLFYVRRNAASAAGSRRTGKSKKGGKSKKSKGKGKGKTAKGRSKRPVSARGARSGPADTGEQSLFLRGGPPMDTRGVTTTIELRERDERMRRRPPAKASKKGKRKTAAKRSAKATPRTGKAKAGARADSAPEPMTPEGRLEFLRAQIDDVAEYRSPRQVMDVRVEIRSVVKLLHGPESFLYVEAVQQVADAYLDNGLARQALEHAMQACKLNQRISHRDPRCEHFHPTILLTVGRALSAQKKFDEAREVLRQALELQMERLDGDAEEPTDILALPFYRGLVQMYAAKGDVDRAVDLVYTAFGLVERTHGPESMAMGSLLMDMGRIHDVSRNGAADALATYTRAHGIFAARAGPDSVKAIEAGVRIAHLAEKAGDYDIALTHLEAAHAFNQRVFGTADVRTVKAHKALGLILVRLRRFADALGPLQDVLMKETFLFTRYNENVQETHSLLGTIHLALGDNEKARQSYEAALDIATNLKSAEHPSAVNLLRRLEVVRKRVVAALDDERRDAILEAQET